MKSIKIMLICLSYLVFLLVFQIGILIGGGKGAETVLGFALAPTIVATFAFFIKDKSE